MYLHVCPCALAGSSLRAWGLMTPCAISKEQSAPRKCAGLRHLGPRSLRFLLDQPEGRAGECSHSSPHTSKKACYISSALRVWAKFNATHQLSFRNGFQSSWWVARVRSFWPPNHHKGLFSEASCLREKLSNRV